MTLINHGSNTFVPTETKKLIGPTRTARKKSNVIDAPIKAYPHCFTLQVPSRPGVIHCFYTADIPKSNQTILATFADDIAILASNSNLEYANTVVQNHINHIPGWV